MPRPESFHGHSDGRGDRRVAVNGVEVLNVLWCDTRTGVVIFAPSPVRIKRPEGDVVYTRRLRGTVTVKNA